MVYASPSWQIEQYLYQQNNRRIPQKWQFILIFNFFLNLFVYFAVGNKELSPSFGHAYEVVFQSRWHSDQGMSRMG